MQSWRWTFNGRIDFVSYWSNVYIQEYIALAVTRNRLSSYYNTIENSPVLSFPRLPLTGVHIFEKSNTEISVDVFKLKNERKPEHFDLLIIIIQLWMWKTALIDIGLFKTHYITNVRVRYYFANCASSLKKNIFNRHY